MIEKEHQQNVVHFANLWNLAFADGKFDHEEYLLLEFFVRKLKITPEERRMIFDNPEKYVIRPVESFSKRLEYIFDFFKIIYANNKLDENEYKLVSNYVIALGFNKTNTNKIVNKTIELFERDLSLPNYEKYIFGN